MANQEKGPGMAGARAASDIELAKGGAQYVEDEPGKFRLEATAEQISAAQEEMDKIKAMNDELAPSEAEREELLERLRQIEAIAAGKHKEAPAPAPAPASASEKIESGRIELADDFNKPYKTKEQKIAEQYAAEKARQREENPYGRPENRSGYLYVGTQPQKITQEKKGLLQRIFGN